MYKLAYNEDLTVLGFYKEDIHLDIPSRHIDINIGLWQYLLALCNFKLVDSFKFEDRIYTIEDIDLFEVIIHETDAPQVPSLEDRVSDVELGLEISLADSNEVIMPYCLDLDYQVSQLNSRLDIIAPAGVGYTLKTNLGGNFMTYTVLKRQIIAQQLTLEKALDMIRVFRLDKKLNDEQAEELTVLAHSYLN